MNYINSLNITKTKAFIAGVMKSKFIPVRKKLYLANTATIHLNNLIIGKK